MVAWKPKECLIKNAPNSSGPAATSWRESLVEMWSTTCYVVVVAASLLSSWEVLSDQQLRKLKTRDSDGAALCAQESQDAPSQYAATSARMSNAPAVIGCSMTCTADQQCQHFNYVDTDPEHPCHLYYYRPTHFDKEPNYLHYQATGNEILDGRVCRWSTAAVIGQRSWV